MIDSDALLRIGVEAARQKARETAARIDPRFDARVQETEDGALVGVNRDGAVAEFGNRTLMPTPWVHDVLRGRP